MLSLHYHKLIGRTEEHEGKKYLMADYYMLDKVFDKIKKITGILKFDNTKILIHIYVKLLDDVTLKNAVILIKCVIKDNAKFYP